LSHLENEQSINMHSYHIYSTDVEYPNAIQILSHSSTEHAR